MAFFEIDGVDMTRIAFVEFRGLLKAGHATQPRVSRTYQRYQRRMEVTWLRCREDFHWDGSWRDIYVRDASLVQWDRFIRALPGWGYRYEFLDFGVPCGLPESTRLLFEMPEKHGPLLQIYLGTIVLNCHFFCDEELEFDLDPREVRAEPEFRTILDFMRSLGLTLEKRVILTPENGPEYPIITFIPEEDRFQYTEPQRGSVSG